MCSESNSGWSSFRVFAFWARFLTAQLSNSQCTQTHIWFIVNYAMLTKAALKITDYIYICINRIHLSISYNPNSQEYQQFLMRSRREQLRQQQSNGITFEIEEEWPSIAITSLTIHFSFVWLEKFTVFITKLRIFVAISWFEIIIIFVHFVCIYRNKHHENRTKCHVLARWQWFLWWLRGYF